MEARGNRGGGRVNTRGALKPEEVLFIYRPSVGLLNVISFAIMTLELPRVLPYICF